MKVANRKIIRRLSIRSMRAAFMRNCIAVAAISLTAILFTSLFTITASMGYAFEQSNFRMVGGYSHGSFKYLTEEQVDELKGDPLVKEYGKRLYLGMPVETPFDKNHVEISWCDRNEAKWMFLEPAVGRFPEEGTREAATDTKVLSLLGVEPELGAEFTLTFPVDGKETTETFTLCGWWDYDEVVIANHILVPRSRAEEILEKLDTKGADGMTGLYNLDIMLKNPNHIEEDMKDILERHGYQNENRSLGDNYIATGVNWGYISAQSGKMDPLAVAAVAGILLLTVFSGYLIIYNVFHISVSNDIRFYGLLKTIGTTGRQIRRIIFIQAMALSGIGIPIGLILGYGIGALLTPVVLGQLNTVKADTLSVNPLIFVGSAVFAWITVLLSCRKPGKIAAKVSPVEAVCFTEPVGAAAKKRKAAKGASLPKMAFANLGRHKGRTSVTVLSLSLAVVLLNIVVLFTGGFDLDRYVSKNIVTDFIVGNASYFQVGTGFHNADDGLPEEVIEQLGKQEGITGGGRVYGKYTPVMEYITQEYFRDINRRWNTEEELDQIVEKREKNEQGLVEERVQLLGMEPFVLDQLTVLEGDLSGVYEPGSNKIAAVYTANDYDIPDMDSHWARPGDTVLMRYVDEYEYYDLDSGEILDPDTLKENQDYGMRAAVYRDVEYEVAAAVTLTHSLGYRYYGADEFIMNDKTFTRDTGTDCVMLYTFNAEDDKEAALENYLKDYTTRIMPQIDYESKQSYMEEFLSFRNIFLLMGCVLCFIIGLVGILNFLNAVLTGILARKREFAVLQSIGMTGRQLKTMLIYEGLYYTVGSAGLAMLLCIPLSPLAGKMLTGMFWFFTYRFTVLPIVCVIPLFVLLGTAVPLVVYHFAAKHTIVERLREAES